MNAAAFWADRIAQQAMEQHKENLVCTGITPSGQIHIGNMREVLTGDAVYRSLLDQGGKTRFVYIADSYDALRRVYPFLDQEQYTPHVGKPISDIPCPCGKHDSYAEHFLEPFLESVRHLGLEFDVLRADRMYKEGRYRDAVLTALERRDDIARILNQQTGKEIADDWQPVNPLCTACGRMTGTTVRSFNSGSGLVVYSCDCGHEGEADAATGGVKLTWRVDWPARWSILGVTVEPFGKDHASRGGSYDTGRQIAKEIFNYQAPVPIVYEWISLKGQGDMSSSKGNVVSIGDILEVVPPDVLRYMIFRTQPKKTISFDPGLPLLSLVDELDDHENKNRDQRAVELSLVSDMGEVSVPFKHLVNIVQIAGDDDQAALDIIARGGYAIPDHAALARRLAYARRWLQNYAPKEMLFFTHKELPQSARGMDEKVRQALRFLSQHLTADMNGEDVHALFYQARDVAGIEPVTLFRAIYRALIDKDRGPRAGWFIAMLDTDFVKQRLLEAAEATS